MLNEASIEAVESTRIDEHLATPLYDGYAFSKLPSLVESLFSDVGSGVPPAATQGLGGARQVVLLLLDGFGWSFFERMKDELPFLQRICRDGVVSKLSAQFPSTTSAHVTTIHTGAPVGETGVFEWFYFEPALGGIFSPLRCEQVGAAACKPL